MTRQEEGAFPMGNVCTILLVDVERRPLMNLHKVPQCVSIANIKQKIAERLKDVGKILPPDLMILKYGEEYGEEMLDALPLWKYNKMALSKINVQILKRLKSHITVGLIRQMAIGKCICMKSNTREEVSFVVCIPSNSYMKQLRMEVARRMNCGIDRHELQLFFDAELQDPIRMEGTCRSQGLMNGSKIYTKYPEKFNINTLAPIDIPRNSPHTNTPQETQNSPPYTSLNVFSTDPTDVDEPFPNASTKSNLQIHFEKITAKSLVMNAEQAAAFARTLGYSPGRRDLSLLPAEINYKTFQELLTASLHAEDLPETFQRFFSIFDVNATGDLSAKQLCNIMQMYGDEPLTKQEATQFTKIIMGKETVAPIKVIVERIMEGQV